MAEATYPSSKNLITLREWEDLLKVYMREADTLDPEARYNLLSLFSAALGDEQAYHANRLSAHQCSMLVSMIKKFGKMDSARCIKIFPALIHGINILTKNNYIPYISDSDYKFVDIIQEFKNVLDALPGTTAEKWPLLEQFRGIYRLAQYREPSQVFGYR